MIGMTRRDLAAEDAGTVCIWVCQLRGTKNALAARADKQLAQAWVERRFDGTGEWHEHGHKYVFEPSDGIDSGVIEFVPVHDVAAILVEDA